MSTYHIDLPSSSDERVVLVKLSGRAQAETIINLLDELNTLAERDSAFRILIDETDVGAGFVDPGDIGGIAQAWREAAAPLSLRICGVRTGERLHRPCACAGLAP